MKSPARPKLFHFTAEPWWILIAHAEEIISFAEKRRRGISIEGGKELGAIVGAEVNIVSAPVNNVWDEMVDQLVWLTQFSLPTQAWQASDTNNAGTEPYQKGAIRIEVDVPDAVRWESYARNMKFDRSYYDALDNTGGRHSKLWWVTKGPVPSSQWVQVVRTRDGAVLYDRARDS